MLRKIFRWLFQGTKITNDELQKIINKNLSALELKLGFTFHNKEHYLKALTHRSYLELFPVLKHSNERLEFLGDSILNMLVGKFLFETYQEEGEGFLTKARSALVNRERLAKAAIELNLEKYLLYNQKYLRDSIDGLHTILADAFEALIGAIYLDRGIDYAENFVNQWIVEPYEEDERFLIDTNYKGQLLEYTHANKIDAPRYVLKSVDGPDHKKIFTVDVFIGTELFGTGSGKNKKTAEQNASQNAIEILQNQ